MELYLLTQFCFAAEPVVVWERRIRTEGNRLPIHVGLSGLASSAALLKFGLSCGVGPSLKVLREQGGNILRLATSVAYHPDQTMVRIARAVSSDSEALFRQFHFYPFGVRVRYGPLGAGRGRWPLQHRPRSRPDRGSGVTRDVVTQTTVAYLAARRRRNVESLP